MHEEYIKELVKKYRYSADPEERKIPLQRLHMINAHIPFRFIEWKLSDFDDTRIKEEMDILRKYVKEIESNAKKGEGLFIHGAVGNGKTCLASIILGEALEKEYSGCFISFVNAMSIIRGMERGVDTENYERENLQSQFLVIDELSTSYAEVPTKSVKATLEELLRYRTNECLPTIITSNKTPKEIEETFDSKIGSLFGSYFTEVHIRETKDMRKFLEKGAK